MSDTESRRPFSCHSQLFNPFKKQMSKMSHVGSLWLKVGKPLPC